MNGSAISVGAVTYRVMQQDVNVRIRCRDCAGPRYRRRDQFSTINVCRTLRTVRDGRPLVSAAAGGEPKTIVMGGR